MASGAETTARRPTVMVVDDDEVIRGALKAWLGQTYEVVDAPDGEVALELVEDTDPDVVVMDVMMPPGPDGIETCRRMKERDRGRYRPVLLLTASNEQARRNAGLQAGADDFLAKPVDRQELLLRVRSFQLLRQQDAQIRRQLEELARLDQMKEDLVALVNHDLMNALSGLIVMMEAIQVAGATCTPEELGTLHAAASGMRETIEDMRRVKQLEQGELALERVAVPLADVVAGALGLVEPTARARSVTILPRVDPRATVMADAVLLRRGVFSLLQNAVKGSPRGGTVEVRARAVGANAEIEICDRAPAVGENAAEHLFEKYAVVSEGQPAVRPRGNRLGLFLVRLVADAHGGEVSVRARPDGGSIYRFVVQLKP